MKTVAQRFAAGLRRLGIRRVFGIPGGAWVDYMEALRGEALRSGPPGCLRGGGRGLSDDGCLLMGTAIVIRTGGVDDQWIRTRHPITVKERERKQ